MRLLVCVCLVCHPQLRAQKIGGVCDGAMGRVQLSTAPAHSLNPRKRNFASIRGLQRPHECDSVNVMRLNAHARCNAASIEHAAHTHAAGFAEDCATQHFSEVCKGAGGRLLPLKKSKKTRLFLKSPTPRSSREFEESSKELSKNKFFQRLFPQSGFPISKKLKKWQKIKFLALAQVALALLLLRLLCSANTYCGEARG